MSPNVTRVNGEGARGYLKSAKKAYHIFIMAPNTKSLPFRYIILQ